jgi:hypothetical protein
VADHLATGVRHLPRADPEVELPELGILAPWRGLGGDPVRDEKRPKHEQGG